MTSDLDLLRQFVRENSQDAFSEIVRRHVSLVYSAALRQVRSPQLAEEIAQSVFSDLARNQDKLTNATGGTPVLTAWLYSVTRRTAIDVIRKESRRQLREQIAVEMNNMNATPNGWTQIEPLLDDAMTALDEADRTAILLRYFENKNLREVGASLNISDDAAQKRVSRAVERLREFFSRQKIAVGASGLVVLISANAVQAAPIGLAVTISAAVVLAGAAVHTSTLITATKAIAMTILQKTVITAALAAAVGTGIFEAHQAFQLRNQNRKLQQQQVPLAEQIQQLQRERDEATNRMATIMQERADNGSDNHELLKLRGEIGVLQRQASEASRKAVVAEENLAVELSAQKQFTKHETATINATKQIGLALQVFLANHNNQYPTNIVQLSYELGGNFTIGGIDLYSIDFIDNRAAGLDHPNMIEFRERLARQAPDGTWRRIYGFADGSVQTATSNDGNFDAWEKANTYSSPPNR